MTMMQPEPQGEPLRRLVSALRQLVTNHRTEDVDQDVAVLAGAIYAALEGDSDRISAFIGRVEALSTLAVAQEVPPAGVCAEDCPPKEPAPYREYRNGTTTQFICDHVPPHRR